mmetsp:Transcript_72805/g.189544  ORF Transcript_72805/g.189544 Transcript_72805/m.189544 type:complete len:230 (-) Transcript_72805:438-1127(-)
MLRAATAVDGGLLVMAQIRLQTLQMSDGYGSYLGPGLLLVLLEGVARQHLLASFSPSAVNEIHEGIADIAHGASVHRGIEKVEGFTEAQDLNLPDELTLRVAVRDVPDHHRSWQAHDIGLGKLCDQVLAPGNLGMLEDPGRPGVEARHLLDAVSLIWALALLTDCLELAMSLVVPLLLLMVVVIFLRVPILWRHGTHGAVRLHIFQGQGSRHLATNPESCSLHSGLHTI